MYMDRRKFIKNTTRLGIGLSLSEIIASNLFQFENTPAVAPFFKISLAQWSFHQAIQSKMLPALEFPKMAKAMGFEGVEYVSQFYAPEKGNEAASMAKMVRELKTRSHDEDIKNVLIMVDGEGELAAVAKQERDTAVSNHAKWVDAAAELGCHSIRVNLFGMGAEKDFKVWKETSVDGLGRLSQLAAKSKINVIVENHGGLSSDSGKLVQVIKEINLPNCGTLPDFGNFCVKRDSDDRWAGSCTEEYDRYKGVSEMLPFAKGVSAKTYDFDANGNETKIDYKRMLKIVKDSGYNGFIGIEYEGTRLGEIEGINATRELLLKSI